MGDRRTMGTREQGCWFCRLSSGRPRRDVLDKSRRAKKPGCSVSATPKAWEEKAHPQAVRTELRDHLLTLVA